MSSSTPSGGVDSPPGWRPPDLRPPPARRRWTGSGWTVAAVVVIAAWLGGFAVNNLRDTGYYERINTIFPRIHRTDRIDDSSVQAAWQYVKDQYYRRDVDPAMATGGAERGLVDYLHQNYDDRFSAYFTRDEYQSLQNNLSGKHSGSVGIQIEARCTGGAPCAAGQQPSVVAIVGVLRNQPAEKAGVLRGDILSGVNGKPLRTLAQDPATQIDRAGQLIRNPAGTQVTLNLLRHGQPVDVRVTDEDLVLPSVFSQRFGSVVYIEVTGFDENTGRDVHKQLGDALQSGALAVVLDLRHNPGGFVTEAQAVASQFLANRTGQTAVVVRRGRIGAGGNPSTATKVESDPILSEDNTALTQRLAVLVDGDSASAAEIVAAALHDYHRGVLVGQRTFGKGSVQQDFGLPDGGDLHLTVEKWFGPAGETIDGTGIAPDRAVSIPDDDHRFRLDAQSADASQDPQLQAALAAVQR